jgi:hypothetical protein
MLPFWVKHSITVALLLTPFSPGILGVCGAQFEVNKIEKTLPAQPHPPFDIDKIENALAAPPYMPQGSQDLANSFITHTLPKLVVSDERLAHQLGFGEAAGNQVTIDRAFAMMLIHRDEVLSLIEGKAKPPNLVNLVNNTNNWLQDDTGRLVPKRIVFLLKAHDSATEAGNMWSSVTMEQSDDGSSWRIIQVGAPKLSRAMNQQGSSGGNYFLLWITDLNRHYLGSIKDHVVTLKVLFKDRLLNGDPNDNQPINSEYLIKLKHLYEELDFPKKLHPKTSDVLKPAQVQENTRPKTGETQKPAQAP